jgi:hypothetical protein
MTTAAEVDGSWAGAGMTRWLRTPACPAGSRRGRRSFRHRDLSGGRLRCRRGAATATRTGRSSLVASCCGHDSLLRRTAGDRPVRKETLGKAVKVPSGSKFVQSFGRWQGGAPLGGFLWPALPRSQPRSGGPVTQGRSAAAAASPSPELGDAIQDRLRVGPSPWAGGGPPCTRPRAAGRPVRVGDVVPAGGRRTPIRAIGRVHPVG